jgi:hypothetical protein
MPAMGSRARVGDLTNPIHAIFRRTNFQNISDDEYSALAPALRLATRLLTTKEIAVFPHALLVAPYGYWKCPNGREEWWFEGLPTLTQQDMAEYETALSFFADMVVFKPVSTEPEGCGICERDWNSTPPQGTHLQVNSIITFSSADVSWAVRNRDTGSELANMKASLMTARILCHELMHAMAYARLGNLTVSPFEMPFGHQTVVETGYEWEHHVLGGLLVCKRPDNIGDTVPRDYEAVDLRHVSWPSAYITRLYEDQQYPLFVWAEPPSIEVHWLIDPTAYQTWIPSLFSTDFWENVVPQQGADAVRAPKLRGIRHEVDAKGKSTEPVDPLALPADTIPAGYEEDPVDGEVVVKSP